MSNEVNSGRVQVTDLDDLGKDSREEGRRKAGKGGTSKLLMGGRYAPSRSQASRHSRSYRNSVHEDNP